MRPVQNDVGPSKRGVVIQALQRAPRNKRRLGIDGAPKKLVFVRFNIVTSPHPLIVVLHCWRLSRVVECQVFTAGCGRRNEPLIQELLGERSEAG